MKNLALLVLIGMAFSACAGEGLDAIVSRRKTMKRIERPVAQRMEKGAILSVYADGSVTTQAVAVATMHESAKSKVAALRDDKATLAAARQLAQRVRGGKHAKDVDGLTDAEVVAAADDVLDTSKKDQAASGAIGAALAAAVALVKKNKPKKEKA